jgi:starch phosphorylase
MVKDYVRELYEPTALQADALVGQSFARARALSAWKRRVSAAWTDVKVLDVGQDDGTGSVDLGGRRSVTVSVELGSLTPEDVAVELVHGPVGSGEELTDTQVVRIELLGETDRSGPYRYQGSFVCNRSGRHGYTVRIVPAHADLAQPLEMGCIAWA